MRKMLLKKRKGAALMWVLMALVLVTIMASTVAFLTSSNLRLAGAQDNSIRAYYVARSGAEVAYERLLDPILPSRLVEFESNVSKVITQNDMNLGNGTADVKVTSYKEGTIQWIKIESIGSLDDTSFEKKVVLDFQLKEPGNFKWTY